MALRLRTLSPMPVSWASAWARVNVDLQKLVQFSRTVSQQLTAGVAYLLKKNGVQVIDGTARLRGKGQITVEDARGRRAITGPIT